MFISIVRSAMAATLIAAVSIVPSALTANANPLGATFANAFARAVVGQNPEDGLSRLLESECLTIGLYHEARGEPEIGQIAVAETILNRVRSKVYPNSICEVVFENSHKTNACQFSFACDGRSDAMTNQSTANAMRKLAREMIENRSREAGRPDFFNDRAPFMTHYHRYDVHPPWSRELLVMVQIGSHVFFRSDRVVKSYGVDSIVTASLRRPPKINASNDIGL